MVRLAHIPDQALRSTLVEMSFVRDGFQLIPYVDLSHMLLRVYPHAVTRETCGTSIVNYG